MEVILEKLEIERRFLLRELPSVFYEKAIEIEQCYLDIEGKEHRIRKYTTLWPNNDMASGQCFDLTHKKFVSEGVFEENITEIRLGKYHEYRKLATKYVEKNRYIHTDFFGLTWEIDQIFISSKNKESFLWIAEIELEDIKQKITIPFEIQRLILMEITGKQELSNRALALNI